MGKAINTCCDNMGYFNPPNVYRPAIIDIRIVGEYSAEDGATNTYRITQNDGKIFEFDVKNGSGGSAGRSVESVEQIQISTESLGKNIARITLSDGTYTDVEIRNGAQGETGPQGQRGPAGIDSVEAAIGTNDPTQAPSVDKTFADGVLSLTFNNIKGRKGDQGEKGETGSSGYSGAAGELEVIPNLTSSDDTAALAASQGKALDEKIGQLRQEIDRGFVKGLGDSISSSNLISVIPNEEYNIQINPNVNMEGVTSQNSRFSVIAMNMGEEVSQGIVLINVEGYDTPLDDSYHIKIPNNKHFIIIRCRCSDDELFTYSLIYSQTPLLSLINMFTGGGSVLSLTNIKLSEGHKYLLVLPTIDWERDDTGTGEGQNIFIVQHLNILNNIVVDENVTRSERLYGAYIFTAQEAQYYQIGGRANKGVDVYFELIDLSLSAYIKYTKDNFIRYVWYTGTSIGSKVVRSESYESYENSYSIKIKVREGEQFIVNASGAQSGRQWYFLDDDDYIVKLADGASVGCDIITAPAGAKYVIVQTNNPEICEIYRFNFEQSQLYDLVNEGDVLDKKYLSRPYSVNSPSRLLNHSISSDGEIVPVTSLAWDVVYFRVFPGDKINVKIAYTEKRYFGLGLYDSIIEGNAPIEPDIIYMEAVNVDETYIAHKEGYIGFSFNKNDGGSFVISVNNNEPVRANTDSNTDYRLIGITERLSGNINTQEQDDFYWGVGCRGAAKFGNTLVGASTTTIADMKPITYENGQVIIENGCVFLTCSTRNTYCGLLIYKMDLGTYQMELVGNIIYKYGTKYYSHYVCSSMMFDRNLHLWIITMDTWEDDQQLYAGSSIADPRFGYHIIEVSPMDIDERHGLYDEDQYILYDDNPESPLYQKYVLVHTDADDNFSIWLQTSDTWDGHYTRYSKAEGAGVSYTGCFTQKIAGVQYIITGTRIAQSPFTPENDEYHILSYPDLNYVGKLSLDKVTGGYGGWGSLFAVPTQKGTKYVMVTFDRGSTSDYDYWTYGTTHVYESVEENPGYEYPLKMQDGYVRPANIIGTYTPQSLHFKRRYAKTFYLCDWLTIEGLWPNALVNRYASNELELNNCSINKFAGEKAIELVSATEGFANVAPFIQLGAFKTLLYNENGSFMFIISNDDCSLYRKLIFTNTDGRVIVSAESKLSSADVEVKNNQASFEYKTNLVEIIVGVTPDKFVIFVKDI